MNDVCYRLFRLSTSLSQVYLTSTTRLGVWLLKVNTGFRSTAAYHSVAACVSLCRTVWFSLGMLPSLPSASAMLKPREPSKSVGCASRKEEKPLVPVVPGAPLGRTRHHPPESVVMAPAGLGAMDEELEPRTGTFSTNNAFI